MLTRTVETYLRVRRSVGFKLTALERYLRNFAGFAANRGDQYIVARTAIDWAAQTTSPEQCHLRLQTVVQLARFSRMEDPRHQIPPAHVFPRRHRRPTPYIFSTGELQAVYVQAARLAPQGSLRPHTYRTILPLMAVTGLRISEAVALRLRDHIPEGLLIRESKFGKSRIVPLHATGHAALRAYVATRREFAAANEDHIFISGRGHQLCTSVVRRTFYQLLSRAGIERLDGQPKPRLMDLRHTYATTVLTAGPDNRDEVCRHTMALSTAMGHSNVTATFWYLERTPVLMSDIADACGDQMTRRQS